MRGLAEFVMRGRKQAILAVVLIGTIPLIYFISPVLVGLVILRKGFQEGSIVLAWALLPIVAWIVVPAVTLDAPGNLLTVIVLLAVAGLAALLRRSGSWQFTVLAAVLVGIGIELYLRMQPVLMDMILAQLNPILLASGASEPVSRNELITLFAVVHMGLAVLLLMVSRWMQAMLYNPGGFRKEFMLLRIERRAALSLLLLILLGSFAVLVPTTWTIHFMMPLLFAGTALVHATVAIKKMSGLWLLAFYTVYPVIVQFLVLFAVIDSWFDFRRHMTPAS
jgi:hypothetical protein